jgi:hypothetical protein
MTKKSAFAAYITEVYDDLGYLPVWPPAATIELGDIGRLDNSGRFVKLTDLKKLGVNFSVERGGGGGNWSYRSKGAVTLKTEADGKVLKVKVTFGESDAVLFDLKGVRLKNISYLGSLEKDLNRLDELGNWKRDYVVITSVVSAKQLVLLVSKSHKSEIEFSGNSSVLPMSLHQNIAAGLTITNESEMATTIVEAGNLTPLFTASKLHISMVSKCPSDPPRGSERNVNLIS